MEALEPQVPQPAILAQAFDEGDAVIVTGGEYAGACGSVGSVFQGTTTVIVKKGSVHVERSPVDVPCRFLVHARGGPSGKPRNQKRSQKKDKRR